MRVMDSSNPHLIELSGIDMARLPRHARLRMHRLADVHPFGPITVWFESILAESAKQGATLTLYATHVKKEIVDDK